jgi:hypothetical protein
MILAQTPGQRPESYDQCTSGVLVDVLKCSSLIQVPSMIAPELRPNPLAASSKFHNVFATVNLNSEDIVH